MQILDLQGAVEFSPAHHLEKALTESPRCSVSIACWEPEQESPIHSHPDADEIYHVLEGEGVFLAEGGVQQLGRGGTVFFPAGEAHQVRSLTRMVLYRVQGGADRTSVSFETWPRA